MKKYYSRGAVQCQAGAIRSAWGAAAAALLFALLTLNRPAAGAEPHYQDTTPPGKVKPPARASTAARKPVPPAAQKPPQLQRGPARAHEFLKVRYLELWRGRYEFTNIGVNIPDLFVRFLNGNDASGILAMQHAVKAGVRFVRCDGCTRSPQEFRRYQSDRSGWLAAFARMLASADSLGIAIVPVLLPDIHLMPAVSAEDSPNSQARVAVSTYLTEGGVPNLLALRYIDGVVGRFKEDPRVLFWEIGDEYNREADLPAAPGIRDIGECYSSDQVRAFHAQVGRYIKSLDKNHIVSTGNTDMRPNSWHLRQSMLAHRSAAQPWNYEADESLDTFEQYSEMISLFTPPPIDIVSVHQSPPAEAKVWWLVEDDDHALRIPWSRQAAGSVPAATAGAPPGKPLFVGAFGQPYWAKGKALDIAWTIDFVRRMRAVAPSLCALNSWETGNTEGDGAPATATLLRVPDLVNQILAANITLDTASLDAPFVK